jgi:hypothetical protein
MAIDPRNLEWLNHNATRSYPLTRDATRQDVTGTFKIPNDFIVSLYLSVPASLVTAPAGFHIKSIVAQTTGYKVVIGYQGQAVATASISSATHTRNAAYRLIGIGDYYDATGSIAIGDLANIDREPAGEFEFSEAAGQLEVDAIRPNIRNIVSLQLQNGQDLSDRITGDVILRAGQNIRLTSDMTGAVPVITIDAIEGEGLIEECVCGEDETPPIRTINGIQPTLNGDFILIGNECVEFEATGSGLRVNDVCSQPCCGCTELEVVTTALETLRSQIATIELFVGNLESKLSALDSALFSSSLGEGACKTC